MSNRIGMLHRHLTSSVMRDPSEDAVSLAGEELFSVKGKVALVTGGSKGIGLMIAKGLVANGAKVYICSRKAKLCDEVAAELNEMSKTHPNGGSAVSHPGDLSSLEGVIKVVDGLAKKESKLHILINNAGATWGGSFDEYPDEAWQKVMDLNVRHLFNLTQKCAPLLRASGVVGDPARVVNIASIDGYLFPLQTEGPVAAFAYSVSKAGVVHLTKGLTRVLTRDQITVNCICPGVFPSNMTKFFLSSEAGQEAASARNPLKRFGRTADIAGTVLYLTSHAGAWTNGAIIALDGGEHLHTGGLIFND